MESSTEHRSSAISTHSSVKGTPTDIEAWLTSSAQGLRVRRTAAPLEAETTQKTNGLQQQRLFAGSGPGSYSSKMLPALGHGYKGLSTTLMDSAIPSRAPQQLPLPLWVRRILGTESGYLPTPTKKDNQLAPSMMKWPNSRRLRSVVDEACGGRHDPRFVEWMMGWPLGASDVAPLGKDRYQQWRQLHSDF